MRVSSIVPFFFSPGCAIGSSIPQRKLQARATTNDVVADASCTNGPFTRKCWADGLSIDTDFDLKWPNTGVTVTYNLELTNITLAPDGYPRMVLAVNGQYPGPTIYANWGDMIEITVKNSLQDNGTAIHWHGMRQKNSNTQDGVPGVTECPLPPGSTRKYVFQATQYGTSWYHSHFSAQYGDGVLGPMVIYGPASANYDEDLGAMPISDWYYNTIQQEAIFAAETGPPTADNGLINGTMVSHYGGKYYNTPITKGKKYRIRLVNTSVDNHFAVSLDGHPFEVITSDLVPIKPYTTSWLFIGIGQRYDVIITANNTVDSYWFRAEVQTGCGQNANNGNIKSIFSYTGAASGDPTSFATNYTQRCTDETQLAPYWDSFVNTGSVASATPLNVGFAISNLTGVNVFFWNFNASSFSVEWDKPTIQYILDGNTSYPSTENLIELPTAGIMTYWVINEVSSAAGPGGPGGGGPPPVPHPIHLHGHDFYVLGAGTGNYSSAAVLNYQDPPRRDVAMLPGGGWLVIAFETDNPGAWLMHCHIAWHAGEGLAVQFLESKNEIQNIDSAQFETECASWDAYWPAHAAYPKDDSGI